MGTSSIQSGAPADVKDAIFKLSRNGDDVNTAFGDGKDNRRVAKPIAVDYAASVAPEHPVGTITRGISNNGCRIKTVLRPWRRQTGSALTLKPTKPSPW